MGSRCWLIPVARRCSGWARPGLGYGNLPIGVLNLLPGVPFDRGHLVSALAAVSLAIGRNTWPGGLVMPLGVLLVDAGVMEAVASNWSGAWTVLTAGSVFVAATATPAQNRHPR